MGISKIYCYFSSTPDFIDTHLPEISKYLDISLILTNLRNITLNTNFINYENQHLCSSACSLIYKLYSYGESEKQDKTEPVSTTVRLLEGDMPDPSVVRVGNTYYMVHSSFIYTPGLVVYSSKISQTGLPARQHYPNIQVTFGLLIFVCTTTVFISISRPAMKKEKKRIWLHGQTALKAHGVNL